jgi:probable HAF family extracellular repeat protein
MLRSQPKKAFVLEVILSAGLFVSAGAQNDKTAAPKSAAEKSPPTFTVVDLGTVGGSSAVVHGISGGQSRSSAAMIVGTSTAADNTSHAFLFVSGQMFDLNELCDLSTSDFAVLTAATSIDNAGQIIGEGVTVNQQRHAFLLTPALVDGGQWSNDCCQWIWKQIDAQANAPTGAAAVETGWWWESESHNYKWHGRPGKHPSCPSNPPHCWSWPLPCPPDTGCQPYPPRKCWCCLPVSLFGGGGSLSGGSAGPTEMSEDDCRKRGGQCYQTEQEAYQYCGGTTSTSTTNGTPTPTPTPTPPITDSGAHYCCDPDGSVVDYGTADNCSKKCSHCYPSAQMAAVEGCGMCYCCVPPNGSTPPYLSVTTAAECQAAGGRCFKSEIEAQDACKAPPSTGQLPPLPFPRPPRSEKQCWCCKNGVVTFGDALACAVTKGKCFDTKEAAEDACSCYCCFNPGKAAHSIQFILPADCKKRGGTCYSTLEAASAVQIIRCSPSAPVFNATRMPQRVSTYFMATRALRLRVIRSPISLRRQLCRRLPAQAGQRFRMVDRPPPFLALLRSFHAAA